MAVLKRKFLFTARRNTSLNNIFNILLQQYSSFFTKLEIIIQTY